MANVSVIQYRNLQNFSAWLSAKPYDYTYIVDGANVAYNRQNFDTGRFSFKQIELVVDKLLQTYGPDTKVLVLLPYAYAQKVVPNSAKNKGDDGCPTPPRRNTAYFSDSFKTTCCMLFLRARTMTGKPSLALKSYLCKAAKGSCEASASVWL